VVVVEQVLALVSLEVLLVVLVVEHQLEEPEKQELLDKDLRVVMVEQQMAQLAAVAVQAQ